MDSPRDVYRDGADALERAVKKIEIDIRLSRLTNDKERGDTGV